MNDDQEQALAQHDAAERAAQEAVRAFGRQLLDWSQSDAGQAWIRLARKDKAMSDTTNELTNRMLAERAGWRVEVVKTRWDDKYYSVHHPTGRDVIPHTHQANGINEWADWELEFAFPDYRGSVDAALTLPLPEGLFFVLMGNAGGWTCSISPRLGVVEGDVEHGSDPADAVCRAWWQFMQMQEGDDVDK